MDTDRLIAAIIRAFWAFVFPMIGVAVANLSDPALLEEVGFTNAFLIAALSSLFYGLKKFFWPDTRF